MRLNQNLPPGCHRLFYCGDVLFLRLEAPDARDDLTGYVRTNLGRGAVRRREVVSRVETGAPLAHAEWHDVRMTEVEAGVFEVRIPLSEPGFFQAKSFVLPPGQTEPMWVEGDNVYLHVQPAGFAAQNSLYNAFVRQFGRSRSKPLDGNRERSARALEEAGYAAIPPSGTFRNLICHLDTIMDSMGFRIIQLLPIFPTPAVYARMGRFGSPFAPTDFFRPDPALAEFDRQSTPLDQFRELTDAIHARGGQVILDIPLNHTGWGSALQIHHPDWFKRNPDGTFQSPGAWGVVWEDLTELEYADRELWSTIADVLLFWCGEGVDGFRCDAGYMIPLPVWEYLTAKVRLQYPETLFFLEGLGGKLSTTETLLGPGGMNWAYSELFQTENREAMDRYLPYANTVSEQRGLLMHFAETHDNIRLAASGRTHAKMRTLLAALCAPNGAFGITNGVEWFAREKVDVHGSSCLNWGATPNLVEELRRLNALLACHPCFHPGTVLQRIHQQPDNAIALLRTNGDRSLLILVNLNATAKQAVVWPVEAFPLHSDSALDILGEAPMDIQTDEDSHRLILEPGQALCLTTDAEDSARLDRQLKEPLAHCGRVMLQRARALAAAVHERLNPGLAIPEDGIEILAQSLLNSPAPALREVAGKHPGAGVVVWREETDKTRQVMVPPNHFLLILAAAPFRVRIFQEQAVLCHEHSLVAESADTHFAILMPPAPPDAFAECHLKLRCYAHNNVHRSDAPILLLPSPERAAVRLSAPRAKTLENDLYAICANQRGAVAHVNGEWGRLDSVYDCLLGANLHPNVPVDRHIMLRRLRAWAVVRGYSTELNADSLHSFGQHSDGSVLWQFRFPAADGLYVTLHAHLRLCELRNRIELRFSRLPAENERDLPDSSAVRLVLRPDLEDRICHGVTKAFDGPEQTWPSAISKEDGGFTFQPALERALHLSLPGGGFVSEPEWLYAVPHFVEASRGLEHLSDLFSPGYLHAKLHGDEHADFSADTQNDHHVENKGHAADAPVDKPKPPSPAAGDASTTLRILEQSMDRFVVRRGEHRTVIAGYPWFLDWGRDTLICLRGLIAAGRLEESRDILIQFARFEQDGTIPNMIRGDDASNRDTSDAPLWLFTALNDLLEADGTDEFLDADAGGRPVRDVLGAIGKNLIAGTPNGIAVDSKTGLVFSPAHFTWMDTNHPAGTPREGYPIEIQALWHAALDLLVRIGDTNADWRELRNQVHDALPRLFFRPKLGYFSDCLHAPPGTSATDAQADDHLRPNQLFALTLGAVDDGGQANAALNACEELLVPGAIRSLANRDVQHQLPIHGPAGLLNQPTHPYWGRYEGDEDTRRKPAYHNGTAWTWPFPSYCEALAKWQGESAQFTALSLLTSSVHLLNQGCIAQLPEIIDGDAPHTFRGCGAQAWSVTELYRVLKLFSKAR